MKKLVCILVAVLLLLTGCSDAPSLTDPVNFYYCLDAGSDAYYDSGSMIHPEKRDLTGHRGDLRYLTILYMAGPLDEDYACPFPERTRLISAKIVNHIIYIDLEELGNTVTEAQFTLAGACLGRTCMEFVSCDQAMITSGSRSITVTRDNLLLSDIETAEQSATGG